MNFDGWYHNPQFAGEGINVRQYGDLVLATVYSYHADGKQLWLVCQGTRDGEHVKLDAWEPVGGAPGDPARLSNRDEKGWGTVTLTDNPLRVNFDGVDGEWGYLLEPVHIPAQETRIKLEKWIGTRWTEVAVPMNSGMVPPSRHRLTVESGSLTITQAYVAGDYSPRMTGVKKGQVIKAGESVIIDYFLEQSGWEQAGGNWQWGPSFTIETAELGRIVHMAVQVKA